MAHTKYQFILAVEVETREDKKESTRKRRRMGSLSDGRARRQTSRYEDATNERARSLALPPVSQSCSDRFDVDGKSAALASGREISERRRRHAGDGHGMAGGDGERGERVMFSYLAHDR